MLMRTQVKTQDQISQIVSAKRGNG
jgi:hypothetical protein